MIVAHQKLDVTELPDDILLYIFSFLPLRSVLQLECLCLRLHRAVSRYLSTLKVINLCSSHIKEDIFREYDYQPMPDPPDLSTFLSRCTQAKRLMYIPPQWPTLQDILSVISESRRILEIEFTDNKEILDKVIGQNSGIALGEVHLLPLCFNSFSTQPFYHSNVVVLNDVRLDAHNLTYFSTFREISLIKCSFAVNSVNELKNLTFPNLRKFEYTEQLGRGPDRAESAKVGAHLIKTAAGCKHLTALNLGLSQFSAIETASLNWLSTELEVLEVKSTGSYSASLQQLRYASIIADICKVCCTTLQKVTLPSSILIKRFFTQLVSSGSRFPQLKSLMMTGIADTKMLLAPGNMVETRFYQEFLDHCPILSSLSLHSYTGSLASLIFPMTLTELVLPWENRLDLEHQRTEISSCLSNIIQLQSLSIFGVEEVDAMLYEFSNFPHLPSLVIDIKSLRKFNLKNTYIQTLDLSLCTSLSTFAIQCCPSLQHAKLPTKSLQKVCIYDDHLDYIDQLTQDLVNQKNDIQIHIQLHSVVKKEPDADVAHKSKSSKLFTLVESACTTLASSLDYLILKDNELHIFDHNSGELLFPFTEFQPQVACFARSEAEMNEEIGRRERVLEGIGRWKQCITDVKSMSLKSDVADAQIPLNFMTNFCNSSFQCATNIPYLMELNSVPYLCQKSAANKNTCDHHKKNHDGNCLNVSRIQPHAKEYLYHNFDLGLIEREWNVNSNPLILISIIEYAHNIHTLFYYD